MYNDFDTFFDRNTSNCYRVTATMRHRQKTDLFLFSVYELRLFNGLIAR